MNLLNDIAYGLHPDQKLDLYLPDGDNFATFVYFHGGGFERTGADKTKGAIMAEYLADHGIAVVCAEYRKCPEAVYPDFIRDCAACVGWTHKHIAEYGGSGKLFVGGSSAGGYASMMLCFDKRWLVPHKLPVGTICGYFHDAGQPTTHFNVLRERGMDSHRVVVDAAAPLFHIGEAAEYPPMHFLGSENDIASRYEQTLLVLSTLKHLGYDMSRVSHQVVPGGHCKYVKAKDEQGESVFGKLVYKFLSQL